MSMLLQTNKPKKKKSCYSNVPISGTNFCLSLGFRHRDQSNSYKVKYLMGTSLQFHRLSSWWEARQYEGKLGVCNTSHIWEKKIYICDLKALPLQWHISSKMAAPILTRPLLLIVSFTMNQAYSNHHRWDCPGNKYFYNTTKPLNISKGGEREGTNREEGEVVEKREEIWPQ